MLKAILREMKSRLDAVCPYEVRFAHTQKRLPENVPFVVLDVKSVNADTAAAEGGDKICYPVTAVVSVSVYVPFSSCANEVYRIFAAYILPVMTASCGSVCGFSQGSMKDERSVRCHMTEVQFRMRGVYIIEKGAEA